MIGAPPPLEGPRVTLDQASFRALASEVRVEVLKKLDERRMTVTDLANVLQSIDDPLDKLALGGDEQLHVNDTAKTAVFMGDVVAVQGDSMLKTPELLDRARKAS